jgi:hypothetical protein
VLAERLEIIGEVGDFDHLEAKARVVEHLRSVNYIVLCQLPGDVDESGLEANGQLLDFFVKNRGGPTQADRESSWKGKKLVVELK